MSGLSVSASIVSGLASVAASCLLIASASVFGSGLLFDSASVTGSLLGSAAALVSFLVLVYSYS